jgi:hypothetical protein
MSGQIIDRPSHAGHRRCRAINYLRKVDLDAAILPTIWLAHHVWHRR